MAEADDSQSPAPAESRVARFAALLTRAQPAIAVALGWMKSHSLITSFFVATLLTAGGITWWWFLRDVGQMIEASPGRVMRDALAALDRRDDSEAQQLVESLQPWHLLKPQLQADALYVMGMVAARHAEDLLGSERRVQMALAAKYLDEALHTGVRDEFSPETEWQLARAQYGAEKYREFRDTAARVIEHTPAHEPELHRMIAESLLASTPPDLPGALKHNALYLAAPGLSAEERNRALMQRADICYVQRDYAAARAEAAKLDTDSPLRAEGKLLEARMLMEEGTTERAANERTATGSTPAGNAPGDSEEPWRARYSAALAALHEAQAADTIATQVSPKAMYLIGLCFQELGDTRAALDQFARTSQKYFDSDEGLAAALRRADLLRRNGRNDDALESYREALSMAGDATQFRNPWLPLSELQAQAMESYQFFRDNREFAAAVELAELLRPLLPPLQGLRLAAEAERTWGQQLLSDGGARSTKQSGDLQAEGRQRLREAGRMYGELADALRETRQFSAELLESAEALLAGQDFHGAVRQLREYLLNETHGQRPAALVSLGTALLSLGETAEARKMLGECIEMYPRDAASYRARLLFARSAADGGEVEEAERLLRENLEGDFLAPASKEWRQSLFALGRTLYHARRFDDAVTRLSEAVERYPDDAEALEARYVLAESHRALARQRSGDLDASVRLGQAQRTEQHLRQSLAYYAAIEESLRNRQRSALLSKSEQTILRNSHFSRGAVLFDLGKFRDSIDAYTNATMQYQDAPEVLQAYERIAECYMLLNLRSEARNILQQARVVLQRMKADAPFTSTTNFTRDEWASRLDSLEELY